MEVIAVSTNRYIVDLTISSDEFRRLYTGSANSVVVRDRVSGKRVRFPANGLRQFVLPDGVHGRFELQVDANNKLIDIQRFDTAHD